MKPVKAIPIALCLVVLFAMVTMSPIPSTAQTNKEEEGQGLEARRLPILKGRLSPNPCFIAQDEPCSSLAFADPFSKGIEKNRLARFDNRDAHGSLFFSFSQDHVDLVVESIAREKGWLIRWDFSEEE